MYRKCVTETSVQHQKQVEQSLIALMRKMPYEDITVTQLCQAANVSRRVFYHLFSNKTGALHAMIDHMILASEGYLPEAPDAVRYFRYWKDRKDFLDALADNQMTGLLLERMFSIVRSEDSDVRNWLKAYDRETGQEILTFNLCGIIGLTFSWYQSGFRKSPEEMAAVLEHLMGTGQK